MPRFASKPSVVDGIAPSDPLDLTTKEYVDDRNLEDLADVTLTGIADGDTIVFNSNTDSFINTPLPTGPTGPTGATGVQGDPGVVISPTAPEDVNVLWADTSEPGDAVLPAGGLEGQSLVKASDANYDSEWATLDTDGVVEGTTNLYNRVPTGGAAGEVLVKASGTNYDSVWTVTPGIVPTIRVSSRWRGAAGVNFGTQLLSAGVARAAPFVVSSSTNFDRIAVIVSTAGSADSVIRLGAYKFDNDGLGMTLAFDAGTVATDTTGVKEIAITQTLPPGAYFLIAASQGTPATHATIRTTQSAIVEPYAAVTNTPNNFITGHRALELTGISGALSSTVTYPLGVGSSINPYNVTLRTA